MFLSYIVQNFSISNNRYQKTSTIAILTSRNRVVCDYTGQQISRKFFVCDEYVINLFVCIYEVRKRT